MVMDGYIDMAMDGYTDMVMDKYIDTCCHQENLSPILLWDVLAA